MSKPNIHLGRGLDSLLPSNFDKSILSNDERIQNLSIDKIIANKNQPRKIFDDVSLNELADSIKSHGVLQPIIVAPTKDGYEIIAGERRWRASKLAKLKTIPAIVRDKHQRDKLEIALIENVQRVDLSALEQAKSILYLHEQFNLSYQEIARKLGKADSTLNNIVRLLQLPPKSLQALNDKTISEGHARQILALKNKPDLQDKLLGLIVKNSWSVRQAEQFVTANKEGIQAKVAIKQRSVKQTTQTKKLSTKLGTLVTIHHTARGGQLQIHFSNDEDLQKLYERLG